MNQKTACNLNLNKSHLALKTPNSKMKFEGENCLGWYVENWGLIASFLSKNTSNLNPKNFFLLTFGIPHSTKLYPKSKQKTCLKHKMANAQFFSLTQ